MFADDIVLCAKNHLNYVVANNNNNDNNNNDNNNNDNNNKHSFRFR